MRTAYMYNFLLEANIMASIAIALMLLLRKTLRRQLGCRAICFGWLMVAVRLLCPLALPNPLIGSIRPSAEPDTVIRPISGQIKIRARDALSDLYTFTRRNMGIPEENAVAGGIRRAYTGMWNGDFPQLLMWVYLVVLACIAGWFVYSNVHFRIQLKKSRVDTLSGEMLDRYNALCEKMHIKPLPVYLCDPLPGACLVGTYKPFIALPLTAKQEDILWILEHELCHYKNKDHFFAPVRLICCAVHWFNPLVWLAAHLSRTDMELRCDERVTQGKTEEQRKTYAAVLVTSAARRMSPGLHVAATGMTMTARRLKSRVGQILSTRQAVRALGTAFAFVCVLLLIGAFATKEYTPRIHIPTFRASMQPEKVPIDRLTAEDAARQWAATPLIDADMGNAAWRTINDVENPGAYIVQSVPNEKSSFIITLNKDGSVLGFRHMPPYFGEQIGVDSSSTEDWYTELSNFVYDFAVNMNPDLAEQLREVRICRDYKAGNRRYVYLELPGDLPNYQYLYCTVQVLPEFRIIELTGGNG